MPKVWGLSRHVRPGTSKVSNGRHTMSKITQQTYRALRGVRCGKIVKVSTGPCLGGTAEDDATAGAAMAACEA
jgi:hypothetical protein